MAVMWSYGTTKIVTGDNRDGPSVVWSYGKIVKYYDGTLADIVTNGVGLDVRLFKQQSPIPDGTFTEVTGKVFETDIEKTITSKGF